MAQHSTELPDDNTNNPDMRYHLVNRILSRTPSVRVSGMGTAVAFVLLATLIVGLTWYGVAGVVDRLN